MRAACAATPNCSKWDFRSSDGGCFVLNGDNYNLTHILTPNSGYTAGISSDIAPPPSPPLPNPPPNPPPIPSSPPPAPPLLCLLASSESNIMWDSNSPTVIWNVANQTACCSGKYMEAENGHACAGLRCVMSGVLPHVCVPRCAACAAAKGCSQWSYDSPGSVCRLEGNGAILLRNVDGWTAGYATDIAPPPAPPPPPPPQPPAVCDIRAFYTWVVDGGSSDTQVYALNPEACCDSE